MDKFDTGEINMYTRKDVENYLLTKMQKNEYKKDEKLPSENILSAQFSLSRIEIRKAYEHLKEMGKVYSKQGKGNYYTGTKEKIELILSGDSSFSKKMSYLKDGFSTVPIYCEKITYQHKIYEALDADETETIFCLKRLRYINEMAVAMHISYLKESVFPDLQQDFTSIVSLYDYFDKKGYHDFFYENTTFTISFLNHEESELMKCQGFVPCLILKSNNIIKENNEILEHSVIVYRGDYFTFKL